MVGELNYNSKILELGNYLPFNLSSEINKLLKNNYQEDRVLDLPKRKIKLRGGEEDKYTEAEERVARVWQEGLGYDEIDINDNFFEIGGDSLIGMEFINLVQKEFNRNDIYVIKLFEYPTLKKFADFIQRNFLISEL